MADRAFIYCPLCRDNGTKRIELLRDSHIFTCVMGHSIPQERLHAMNPEMIKMDVIWKPGPHDVKTEVWVNEEVLSKAKEVLGARFHPTIDSILRAAMLGEFILVDGKQAAELKKLGVRTGQEMLATAQQNQTLVAQNEELSAQVTRWENRIAEALAGRE